MILKMLSVVIACNFLNSANALHYEIDDQRIHGTVSLPFAAPDKIYSLKNSSKALQPSVISLEISEQVAPNGKFIKGSNLTFEEQTLLVGHSPSCVNVKDSQIFVFDPTMSAIKSYGDVRVFGSNTLQLNNCTVISEVGNIILQGSRVQGNIFFKTLPSKSLYIVPDHEYEEGINGIVLTPYFFSFISKIGMSLPSSSAYVSLDVDFAKKNYDISFQCVGSLSLTDKFPEFPEKKSEFSAPSLLRKKAKTEDKK